MSSLAYHNNIRIYYATIGFKLDFPRVKFWIMSAGNVSPTWTYCCMLQSTQSGVQETGHMSDMFRALAGPLT